MKESYLYCSPLCPHSPLCVHFLFITLRYYLRAYLPDYRNFALIKYIHKIWCSVNICWIKLSCIYNYNTIQSWLLITSTKQNSPSISLKFVYHLNMADPEVLSHGILFQGTDFHWMWSRWKAGAWKSGTSWVMTTYGSIVGEWPSQGQQLACIIHMVFPPVIIESCVTLNRP